jgi:hypothetical protein
MDFSAEEPAPADLAALLQLRGNANSGAKFTVSDASEGSFFERFVSVCEKMGYTFPGAKVIWAAPNPAPATRLLRLCPRGDFKLESVSVEDACEWLDAVDVMEEETKPQKLKFRVHKAKGGRIEEAFIRRLFATERVVAGLELEDGSEEMKAYQKVLAERVREQVHTLTIPVRPKTHTKYAKMVKTWAKSSSIFRKAIEKDACTKGGAGEQGMLLLRAFAYPESAIAAQAAWNVVASDVQ